VLLFTFDAIRNNDAMPKEEELVFPSQVLMRLLVSQLSQFIALPA
jgi:hypothetical protein